MYVHKFLADAGCGSRRNMIEAMKQGKVKVNGRTTQDPTFQIDPLVDQVSLGKRIVKAFQPKIYLMLNKPVGYLTTNQDPQGRPTVFDLVPEEYKDIRLFAIGRLDEDTEGLLILTNDGEITYKLTHPKFEHEKEYIVTIGGELSTRQIRQLERGVMLEDGKTSPAKVKQIFDSQQTTYAITIHEGKKRQVRRMFEHVGFRVLTLKRIRIGALTIDPKLKSGTTTKMTPQQIELALSPRPNQKKASRPTPSD